MEEESEGSRSAIFVQKTLNVTKLSEKRRGTINAAKLSTQKQTIFVTMDSRKQQGKKKVMRKAKNAESNKTTKGDEEPI